MAASGDVLRFVDGSEFRITKAAADTNGEYLEMEWWLPPSTEGPPKHIPPHQREDYEVLESAFEVFVAMAGARWPPGSRPRRPARCIRSESATGPCAFGTCTHRRSTSRTTSPPSRADGGREDPELFEARGPS